GAALSERHAPGELRGNHAASKSQRRESALRQAARGRESLFEVGVCGGCEFGGGESQAVSGSARQPTLSAAAIAQRTRQSHRGRGAPSGGSDVSRAAGKTTVSESRSWSRSDQRGVSANLS